MKEELNLSEHDAKYLPGLHNRLIRYYYYLEQGLNMFNEFKYLFLAIAGVYVVLRLESWWWFPALSFPSLFILAVLGYYNVHKLSKVKEWITYRFSTHYAIRNFDFQEEQVKLLREIKAILEHE